VILKFFGLRSQSIHILMKGELQRLPFGENLRNSHKNMFGMQFEPKTE
jgi:hypothetical protein